jgi:hypothetical protein
MKNKMQLIFRLLVIITVFFNGCKKDDKPNIIPNYNKGFYIVNEGGFLQGNGSLSFYDADKDTMINDLFSTVNGIPLGDVFQSMAFYKGRGYLVVNNSQKVVVVDSSTMSVVGTITGLTSPRGIYFYKDKAYITDLISPNISVYNALTLAKIKEIPVGGSTEKIVELKDTLFATVQQLDYSNPAARKGIVAIQPILDTVVRYLELSEGAFDIVVDGNFRFWVMCSGDFNTGVKGALYKISNQHWKIESEFKFDTYAYYSNALKLSPNGLNLYFMLPDPSGGFTESDIYRMNVFSSTIPDKPLYDGKGKYIYGFGFNELIGELYVLDAVSGGQKGNLVRVDINTGADIKKYEVGYFPNNIVFRQ